MVMNRLTNDTIFDGIDCFWYENFPGNLNFFCCFPKGGLCTLPPKSNIYFSWKEGSCILPVMEISPSIIHPSTHLKTSIRHVHDCRCSINEDPSPERVPHFVLYIYV